MNILSDTWEVVVSNKESSAKFFFFWVCVLQENVSSCVSESFTIKSSAYNFLRATSYPRSFQNLFNNSSPVLCLQQEVTFCQIQINSDIQKAEVQFPAPNSRFQAHLWFLQNISSQLFKIFDWKKKTKVIKVYKSVYVYYCSRGYVYS